MNMQKCSGCGVRKPEVDRDMFDGLCGECTNQALLDDEFREIAQKENEKLKERNE